MNNYWWVSHNQNAFRERTEGYLWCPKINKRGNKNGSYDFMKIIRPGDLIVSFANSHLSWHGIILDFPITALPPNNHDLDNPYESDYGWLTSVSWSEIPRPFRPKDYIARIYPLLPDQHSPLRRNGNGNQNLYLSKISNALFKELQHIGTFSVNATQIEDNIQKNILRDDDLSSTQKESLIQARIGQGIFRRNVEDRESCCRVTGLKDKKFLIASHIKPWRMCTTAQERLDGANGLLLAPHIDRLFDANVITFEKDGRLHISSTLSDETVECLGLRSAQKNGVEPFSKEQDVYLKHHREKFIF